MKKLTLIMMGAVGSGKSVAMHLIRTGTERLGHQFHQRGNTSAGQDAQSQRIDSGRSTSRTKPCELGGTPEETLALEKIGPGQLPVVEYEVDVISHAGEQLRRELKSGVRIRDYARQRFGHGSDEVLMLVVHALLLSHRLCKLAFKALIFQQYRLYVGSESADTAAKTRKGPLQWAIESAALILMDLGSRPVDPKCADEVALSGGSGFISTVYDLHLSLPPVFRDLPTDASISFEKGRPADRQFEIHAATWRPEKCQKLLESLDLIACIIVDSYLREFSPYRALFKFAEQRMLYISFADVIHFLKEFVEPDEIQRECQKQLGASQLAPVQLMFNNNMGLKLNPHYRSFLRPEDSFAFDSVIMSQKGYSIDPLPSTLDMYARNTRGSSEQPKSIAVPLREGLYHAIKWAPLWLILPWLLALVTNQGFNGLSILHWSIATGLVVGIGVIVHTLSNMRRGDAWSISIADGVSQVNLATPEGSRLVKVDEIKLLTTPVARSLDLGWVQHRTSGEFYPIVHLSQFGAKTGVVPTVTSGLGDLVRGGCSIAALVALGVIPWLNS